MPFGLIKHNRMTEAEWLACDDPSKMAAFLDAIGTPRQHRLCVCGCVRLVWDRLADVRSRQAVEASERYADGECGRKDLQRAYMNAGAVADAVVGARTSLTPTYDAAAAAQSAAQKGTDRHWGVANTAWRVDCINGCDGRMNRPMVAVVRDIFNNPFRPVTIHPECRTSTVLALAQQMYDTRDFSAMPILGDALMDAGCFDEAILTHCRGAGPHVRGCWVVDAALNKA